MELRRAQVRLAVAPGIHGDQQLVDVVQEVGRASEQPAQPGPERPGACETSCLPQQARTEIDVMLEVFRVDPRSFRLGRGCGRPRDPQQIAGEGARTFVDDTHKTEDGPRWAGALGRS